jgi:1-acyl-sn-glycerol-3-phosphate acyltransferase
MAATATSTDTNPSLGLKLQTYLCLSGFFALILAVNIGGILLNVAGSRPYVLAIYASLRLLTPGGFWNSGKIPEAGSWRRFSEELFFPATIMRRYLDLSFAEPPPEFVKAEAEEDSRFIFAAFPHGCNCEFRICSVGVLGEVIPNLIKRDALRTLAASILFKIPVFRELSLWTGCIDASRKCAEEALSQQKSLMICPGGEAEQIMTTYGREKVYLSKRKGFIKLAMRKGVPVVPIYVFGSSDSYYTFHDGNGDDNDHKNRKFDWTLYKLRYNLMKNFGICITVCSGLWGSQLCPLPKKTTIVFGKPIRFEPAGNNTTTKASSTEGSSDGGNPTSGGFEPTNEELDKAHALFVKELTVLFDAHKEKLGYGDRTLEVI